MTARRVIVRCVDRSVFEVNPDTLAPHGPAVFDPWCYTRPIPGVEYLDHAEWCLEYDRLTRRRKRAILDADLTKGP